MAVEYFLMNEWTFQHDNFMKLCDDIQESDRKDFQTNHFVSIDFKAYLGTCILGTKRYLFNEKDENIPKTLVKRNRSDKQNVVLRTFNNFCFYFCRLILADKTIKGLLIFIIGFYTYMELKKNLGFV